MIEVAGVRMSREFAELLIEALLDASNQADGDADYEAEPQEDCCRLWAKPTGDVASEDDVDLNVRDLSKDD